MIIRHWIEISVVFILTILLSACQARNTVCLHSTDMPRSDLLLSDMIEMTPVPASPSGPIIVEIGGKMIEIDKLVDYPLCNDNGSGYIYVNCDARVAKSGYEDGENPLFFKGCALNIEPNTIVYVAAHNDTPYYKGCSCHTGEEPINQ